MNNDDAELLPERVRLAAERHINSSSPETVLGHHSHGYLDTARRSHHHANHFDIGPDWDALTPEQQWAANRLVLDHTIGRDHVVRLAAPRSAIRPGSGLEKEVAYLLRHGYRFRSTKDADLYLVPAIYPDEQPRRLL